MEVSAKGRLKGVTLLDCRLFDNQPWARADCSCFLQLAWLFYHRKQETGREQPAAGQRSGQKRREADKSTVSRQGLVYSNCKERPANREIGEEEGSD